MKRYRLAWIASHRDTYEVVVADDPTGRIEIDPGPKPVELLAAVEQDLQGADGKA